MKEMYFNRLTIISKIEKKAAQFDFSKNYNLVLSKQKNSVGKSSLVKSIFWCLGCEPQFDEKWKALDCRVVLDFEVRGNKYQLARHGNRFILKDSENKFKEFSSVGAGFSTEIMALLNFNALLAVRDKEEIVTPPPAYYFLPFYIDQKQSWANAWVSFGNLGQFSNWKKTIIPYHTGMTGKDYFDKTEEIYSKKVEASDVKKEIDRLDTAISVVSEFPAETGVVIEDDELNEIEEQINVEIMDLHFQQEVLFEELATLRADKAHIESQIIVAKNACMEASEDYEFAESLGEDIECPTCGVIHDNSIVNRFSLLQDKNQSEDIIARLGSDILLLNDEIEKKTIEFNGVRENIRELDQKYSSDKGGNRSFSSILEIIASNSVKKKVEGSRSNKVERLHNLTIEEKNLVKERVERSKENRKKVKEKFQKLFPHYLAKLKAFGVNASSIKSPENHSKVAASGGAAESTRAMLAYYMSVYNLIDKYGEHVLCPFVIDTPNQHEQAAKHYDSIVSLLLQELPERAQLFVCGMDSEKLQPLKDKAKIIYLDVEHSLLSRDLFKYIDSEYSGLFEMDISSV
ncbi:hypothetical protein HOP52_13420 [Halomonas campisalis]|uniref:Uncharacterized protein n=1 Tax=Billgrantia campisalis TaxID=74661 RepID=A0ABS9PBE1_9GAMM|nr:hypothetical protein [Halomonas campisalis]MCG6658754.1 hypothetical protein [Halomonas campisalis]MDR5864864.1 hypothetical protein [Halomonas campisalis]